MESLALAKARSSIGFVDYLQKVWVGSTANSSCVSLSKIALLSKWAVSQFILAERFQLVLNSKNES